MSPYRIISLDLDGTLLDVNKKISDNAKRYLIDFQANGGYVVLSSGRKLKEIEPYARELCLEKYNHGYVIASSGCYLFRMSDRTFREFNTLRGEEVFGIVKKLHTQNSNITYTVVTPTGDYYIKGSNRFLYYVKNIILKIKGRRQCFLTLKSLSKYKGKVEKIMAMTTDVEFIEKTLLEFENIKFNIIDRNRTEIFKDTIDKYYAIYYLLKELNLTSRDLLLFGDDENDLMCFEKYDNCIAMGNAIEIIKEKSKYVTSTNEEDGVYKFLINN